MISYDKKFIFVQINKTAGTSMEKALADYGVKKLEEKGDLKFELNYNQSQHFNCDEYKKYLGSEYDDYFKFSDCINVGMHIQFTYINQLIGEIEMTNEITTTEQT